MQRNIIFNINLILKNIKKLFLSNNLNINNFIIIITKFCKLYNINYLIYIYQETFKKYIF